MKIFKGKHRYTIKNGCTKIGVVVSAHWKRSTPQAIEYSMVTVRADYIAEQIAKAMRARPVIADSSFDAVPRGRPVYFCLAPCTGSVDMELLLWPIPDEDAEVIIFYHPHIEFI